ncbi:hypothetical protein CEXT_726051 [Caerostris extrusa]|uniref:Secreted protein n=1 Tax=Caerostris extrusa TaxID=172846 RepID=A0AAV4NRF6_CAEEX|nr:hypothetical protein CEXT_726051 [Caerostris extrusa]
MTSRSFHLIIIYLAFSSFREGGGQGEGDAPITDGISGRRGLGSRICNGLGFHSGAFSAWVCLCQVDFLEGSELRGG